MSVAVQAAVAGPERYRLPVFWPSQIKLYLECPERYYHKYVARRRVVEPFSRDLARGIALHAVAAECFTEFQRSGGFPAHIEERVEAHLLQANYPAAMTGARDEDATSVTTYIKRVLSEFDCTSQVLGVEQTLSYYWNPTAGPACLFRAKVDLVLLHTDGSLEHFDFKGGKVRPDPIQEVISRIVVAAEHSGRFPNAAIRTTTHYVAEQQRVGAVLDGSACKGTWAEIKRAVAEIQAGEAWRPSPSPFCERCPYFGNGCSINFDGTKKDVVTEWLEGENS